MNKTITVLKVVYLDIVILISTIILIVISQLDKDFNTTAKFFISITVLISFLKVVKIWFKELKKIDDNYKNLFDAQKALRISAELLEFPINLIIGNNPKSLEFFFLQNKKKESYLEENIINSFFSTNLNPRVSPSICGEHSDTHGLVYDISNNSKESLNKIKDVLIMYSDVIDTNLKTKYYQLENNIVMSSMLKCYKLSSDIFSNEQFIKYRSEESIRNLNFTVFNKEDHEEDYRKLIDFIFELKEFRNSH